MMKQNFQKKEKKKKKKYHATKLTELSSILIFLICFLRLSTTLDAYNIRLMSLQTFYATKQWDFC